MRVSCWTCWACVVRVFVNMLVLYCGSIVHLLWDSCDASVVRVLCICWASVVDVFVFLENIFCCASVQHCAYDVHVLCMLCASVVICASVLCMCSACVVRLLSVCCASFVNVV